jgi:hypothetical protein
MADYVFISYAAADQATANRLVAEIEKREIPCWISSRNIRPGQDYQNAIVRALEGAGVVLLLFSQAANESAEIPKELALASKFKKTIIPARIMDIVPSGPFVYQMTTAQFIDLFRDFEAKVDELCSYLGETLQVTEVVRQRIAREQSRRAIKRKFRRVGIAALILLVLVGVGFAAAPQLVRWFAARENPDLASQNPSASAPRQPVQPAPAQPPPVAASPPAAVSEPAPAPPPPGTLASRTYEGVRFDVMSIGTEGNYLRALVTATNTLDRSVELKLFVTPAPMAIDNFGAASSSYRIDGVPSCGGSVSNCSVPDPSGWSKAYRDNPVQMVLRLPNGQGFNGSTVSISFRALLGIQTSESSPPQIALVPVAFTNLPLKAGAVASPTIASRTYDGIRFDVMSISMDRDDLCVLITATNILDRNASLKLFETPEPIAIDNLGTTSRGYRVDGIPSCGGSISNCSAPDPSRWSRAYRDSPIQIVLRLSRGQGFNGSTVSISFRTLLGVEPPDGGRASSDLLDVSFAGLPLHGHL